MPQYEHQTISVHELTREAHNPYGSKGWRVVGIVPTTYQVILEREKPQTRTGSNTA